VTAITPIHDREVYPARTMIAPIDRRPEDAWLALISNRNG